MKTTMINVVTSEKNWNGISNVNNVIDQTSAHIRNVKFKSLIESRPSSRLHGTKCYSYLKKGLHDRSQLEFIA